MQKYNQLYKTKSNSKNSYPLTNMEINCAMSTFSKIFAIKTI